MMYGSNRQRSRMNQPDLFLQRRVLLIVCILLLGAVIALGFLAVRNGTYRDRAEMQFSQRMDTAVSSAIGEVNRMGGYATSSSNVQLSRIRQYIYYTEQLNVLSMALAGGEAGRMVPDAYFTQLYSDLDTFEAVVQQSTTSTLDIRSQLLNHLTQFQAQLRRN